MDQDWISKRVNEALQESPVAERATSVVEERLKGTMSERALKPAELAELANTLLAAMGIPATEDPLK